MASENTKNTKNQRSSTRWKTILLVFGVMSTIMQGLLIPNSTSALGPIMLFRPPAPAGGFPVANIPGIVDSFLDRVWEGLKWTYEHIGRVAVKNLVRTFLTRIAYDTAVWIASGDNNQKPLLFTDQWGTYLQDAGDAALGDTLQELATENGYLKFDLCNFLNNRASLAIQLGLDFAVGRPYKPRCTFSEIYDQYEKLRNDPEFQKKFLSNFKLSWDIEQNNIGQFLSLQTTLLERSALAEKAATLQRQASDPFKDVQGKISQFIETPAQVVAGVEADAFKQSKSEFTVLVGDPAADALGVFTSTLVSKLMDRIKGGVYSFGDLVREDYRNEQGGFVDETGFTSPGSSGEPSLFNPSSSSAPGVAAAEAQYASIADISFTSGDEFQVLADLVACPSDGAQANNCAIDEKFRIAINDRLTVREALEQKLLDGKKPFGFTTQGQAINNVRDGYSYRSIILLQRYLIVPVGWKIAAEYIRDFNPGNFTLTDLVAAYDNCGVDDYSPFCGLVDPDWVLKAPANYCRKRGFGNPVTKPDYFDADANPATPKKALMIRQGICVDDQSCIQENPDGTCRAYGYCTEQKRIWRFVGERCEAAYNTCRTVTDTASGQRASLLLNTVNFNDCSRDVAGCQWLCQVFNPLDNDWQCAGNGSVYPTCDAAHDLDGDGDCTATAGGSTCAGNSCEIARGHFRCKNTDDEICYLPPENDDPRQFNDASISLDRDAPNCDANNAGCQGFISTRNGTNLINNPSFEYFADNPRDPVPLTFSSEGAGDVLNDNDTDVFGFCDGRGGLTHACSSDTDCAGGKCVGWKSFNNPTVFAVSDPVARGQVAVKFIGSAPDEDGDGIDEANKLLYEYESNAPLANRAFDLSLRFRKTSGQNCIIRLGFAAGNQNGEALFSTQNEANDTWIEKHKSLIVIPSSITDTSLQADIELIPAGCEIFIDEVKLEEVRPLNFETATATAVYTDYDSTNKIHLNGQRLSCEPKDLGCEAYADEKDGTIIPAVITNPVSDFCTNGSDKDYSKASCNQCDQGQVGCDFYEEVPLRNQPPDPLAPERTGFYCSNYPNSEARSCTPAYCSNNPNILCDPAADINTLRAVCMHSNPTCVNSAPAQCGDPNATCLPQVSIIPKTGKKCQAQHVGCEEYTNLDVVNQGGEGLEYYSRIKQCVKPVEADPTQGTYYTWVGSDTAGYQLKAFKLKKSNLTDHSYCPENRQICDADEFIRETGVAPCSNLDVSDTGNPNADCKDLDQGPPAICAEADLATNPDCGQFYDSDGNIFYRLRSRVISVSEECNPLRSTIDNNVYYAIRKQSKVCPANMNSCREYKGSAGNNVRILLKEDFENTTFEGAGLSSEGAIAGFGDQSMEIRMERNTDPNEGFTPIPQTSLTKGNAYIVSFWARSSTNTDANKLTVSAVFRKQDRSGVLDFGETTLEPANDWNFYRLGPLVFDREVTDQEVFAIRLNPQDGNYPKSLQIDNLKITDSASQYLIKGSAAICPKFEGCREYADRQDRTNYLKSFTRLCEERFLGCEIAIDTQNSNLPFAESFNLNNTEKDPQGKDDVIVPADQATLVVNNPKNSCFATAEGCSALGQPNENRQESRIEGFSTTYRIKDPDTYGTTLCQDHQVMCREYQYGESMYYFKDPGNKACEYKVVGQNFDPLAPSRDIYGWAKLGKDEACPVLNRYDFPSRPSGSVCASGDREGQPCQRDNECPASFCTSDVADDPTTPNTDESRGWVGACPESADSCTLYLDTYGTNPRDDVIPNSSFEVDARNNATGEYVADDIPDSWTLDTCDDGNCVLAKETDQVRSGDTSLKITGDDESRFTLLSEPMRVDPNDIYTLRGYVRTNSNALVSLALNIGLNFYDRDGNRIWTNSFIAAANEVVVDLPAKWIVYQGTIGPTQKGTAVQNLIEFPLDTWEVKVRIEGYTDSNGIFLDDISLDHNDEYYYLENTVDAKTCRGNANRDDGCVVLNNTIQTTQNYQADDPRTPFDESKSITRTEGYDPAVASCELNSVELWKGCRARPNAAVGNQVIKARPDRDCKEWLACSSAYAVENPDTKAKEYFCFDVSRCRNLSEDGVCNDWVRKPYPEELTNEDSVEVITAPGDTEELEKIQNLTGYVRAGLQTVVPNPQGGSLPVRIKGYYTFDAMPQVGITAANSSRDIVSNGKFEDTSCVKGNLGAACTLDQHCRKMEPFTGELYPTEEGACANPPRGWSKTGNEDNTIQVIDFDETLPLNYDEPESINLDLSNVLKVTPSNNASNGTQVRVDDERIELGGEYVVSFEGRYSIAPTENDTLRIGFSYNTRCTDGRCSRDKVDMFSNVCQGGERDGLFCDPNAGPRRCVGGDNAGGECTTNVDCPNGGTCTAKICVNAGENEGLPCLDVSVCQVGLPIDQIGQARCGVPSSCPGGVCVPSAFTMTGEMQKYTLGPIIVRNKPTQKETRCSKDPNRSCKVDDDCVVQQCDERSPNPGDECSDDSACGGGICTIVEDYGVCVEISTTSLFFEQTTGSGNTPFYIDNVSLKPALEVSKVNSLVSRSCRSYPREEAPVCDYTDVDRITYRGWYGYCLEYDPQNKNQCLVWWPVDNLSGESSIAPRVRAGYNERTPLYMCVASSGGESAAGAYCVNYRAPQYGGIVCGGDGDCGPGGRCVLLDGGRYILPTKEYDLKVPYEDGGYLYCANTGSKSFACASERNNEGIYNTLIVQGVCVTNRACGNDLDCTNGSSHTKCLNSRCVGTKICDNNGDCDGGTCELWYDLNEEDIIPGYCQKNIFKRCDIRKELDGDGFTGDCLRYVTEGGVPCIPRVEETGVSNTGEVRATVDDCDEDGGDVFVVDWGPCIPSLCENMGGVCASEPPEKEGLPTYGGVCVESPDFACGDGTTQSGADMRVVCPDNNGDGVSEPCRESTIPYQCVGGSQPGVPCGDDGGNFVCPGGGYCSDRKIRFDGDTTGRLYHFASQLEEIPRYADIQFVQFDPDGPTPLKVPAGLLAERQCDGVSCQYGGSDFGSDPDDIYAIIAPDDMPEGWNPFETIPPAAIPYSPDPFYPIPAEPDFSIDNEPLDDAPEFLVWSSSTIGNSWPANEYIAALWLDFERGKIKDVWVVLWGAENQEDIGIKFYLRESCMYFAQTVDETGRNNAWVQRTKRGSEYRVPEVLLSFYSDYEPFGGMTPSPVDDPAQWDSRPRIDLNNAERGNQPLFVELPDNDPADSTGDAPVWQFRAGSSYGCAGDCGQTFCDNTPDTDRVRCDEDSDCTFPANPERGHGRCIGAIGGVSRGGVTSGNTQAQEDRDVANDSLAGSLRHVFANIIGALAYVQREDHEPDDPNNPDTPGGYLEIPKLIIFEAGGGGLTYYETMPVCSGQRDDNDYCGFRPSVSHITINDVPESDNMEVDLGRAGIISLTFSARVDPEQYPLNTIVIDWDDGSSAMVDPWEAMPLATHTYIHTYDCAGPQDPNYNAYVANPDSRCHFNPKIRIVDNWDWCSGNEVSNIGAGPDAITRLTTCDADQDCRNIQNTVDDAADPRCNTWDVLGSPGRLGLIHVSP